MLASICIYIHIYIYIVCVSVSIYTCLSSLGLGFNIDPVCMVPSASNQPWGSRAVGIRSLRNGESCARRSSSRKASLEIRERDGRASRIVCLASRVLNSVSLSHARNSIACNQKFRPNFFDTDPWLLATKM